MTGWQRRRWRKGTDSKLTGWWTLKVRVGRLGGKGGGFWPELQYGKRGDSTYLGKPRWRKPGAGEGQPKVTMAREGHGIKGHVPRTRK